MSHSSSQKMATGLVVNRYPNIPAKFYQDTRVWVDRYARTGRLVYREFSDSFGANCPNDETDDENAETDRSSTSIERLAGRLAHIVQTRCKTVKVPTPSENNPDNPQFWKLLQKFAFVRNFVANERATLVTEGPSDIINIKSAIKLNPDWAPHIYNEQDKRFLVKFFPHEGVFAKCMGIEGGAGDIRRFLDFFYKPPKRINTTLRKQPVILITDNDKACSKIFSRLSNIHGIQIDVSQAQFAFKLQQYLYLLKSPHAGAKKETCIEDMFKSNDLKEPINGKKFEPDQSKFDPLKHISKVAFATLIGRKNDKEKYSGFEEYIRALDNCVSQSI